MIFLTRRQQKSDENGCHWIEIGLVKHAAQKDSQKRKQGANQAGTIFQKNGKDRRIFTSYDFFPGTLVMIGTRPEFAIRNDPRIEFKYGREC